MYILAYKDGHDSAACLLKDGEIVAAAEEERFIRKKHAPSVFPERSIRFCLEFAGIAESEVDEVVYARLKPLPTALRVFGYYFIHPPMHMIALRYAVSHLKVQFVGVIEQFLGRAGYQKIAKKFPGLPKKIASYDHHLLHAASAYYFSGFDKSLVITWDGKGEATSAAIAYGEGNNLKMLERRGIYDSLGLLYSAATKYLGFTPNDGEYKVMGLAPYGSPEYNFSDILRPDPDTGYWINSRYSLYPVAVKRWEEKFGPKREKDSELSDKHKNLAASLQNVLEQAGMSFVEYALKKYLSDNVCFAGGVAYNVKLNQKIWESGMAREMFIQPAAGDAGLVFGAVALHYAKLTGKRVKALGNIYYGPEFFDLNIENELKDSGLAFEKASDVAGQTAKLLSQGKVIGWFQGRMEFGPRALGNRSVLANPTIAEMRDIVNKKIKFREAFRPFCPSVLAEHGPAFCKNYYHAPYMIISFSAANEELRRRIPAVIHIDGTLRPQAVEKDHNPLYHKLLSEFHRVGGVPVLLNTSMNIRGEPVVCSPRDAIDFFLKTNVDALVIGNYILIKSEQKKEVLRILKKNEVNTEY